jgi:4a-hydroxytetrahydrobiopterin dehydratase
MADDPRHMTCVPCRGGVDPLAGEELAAYASYVPQWELIDDHHIVRVFTFRNFVEALAFVNRVGELAEEMGHHPDILLGWGKVEITLHTHKIDGLHGNDFILAAHIDGLD